MFLSPFSHPRDDQLSLWVGANWGAQSASWNKKSGCNGRYEDIVQVNYHAQVTAEPVVLVLVLYHVIVRNAFYNSCWEMTQSSTDDSSCVRAAVLLRFFYCFIPSIWCYGMFIGNTKRKCFFQKHVSHANSFCPLLKNRDLPDTAVFIMTYLIITICNEMKPTILSQRNRRPRL